MAPWEVVTQLKATADKLAAVSWPPELAEVPEMIATLFLVIETQHHDIQTLKGAVARLEHLVRHRAPLP